jgi:hypothetical protein
MGKMADLGGHFLLITMSSEIVRINTAMPPLDGVDLEWSESKNVMTSIQFRSLPIGVECFGPAAIFTADIGGPPVAFHVVAQQPTWRA